MKLQTLVFALVFLYTGSYAQTHISRDTSRIADIRKSKNKTFRAKLFIVAGAAFNGLKITGDDSYFETQVDHKEKLSPVMVFGVTFPIQSPKGAWFVSPKIGFYSLHADGTVELHSGLATFYHESSVQSKAIVNPGAVIGCNFINQPACKLYAAAGLGALFFAGAKENQTTTFSSGDQIKLENKPAGMAFVLDAEIGFDIGRHLGIVANYQPPVDLFRYVYKKVMFSSLQAGIRWSL